MTTVARRHALGLPAGSVRSLLALIIVGLVCVMMLVPKQPPIAPYLVYLLFLVLGHLFTQAIGPASSPGPLYLPAWLVRLLIVAAVVATVVVKLFVFQDEEGLRIQFDKTLDAMKGQPFLPLLLLGGFFVGVLLRAVLGRDNPPLVWQEVEAWLSLLAMGGLCIAAIIHLVIAPSVHSHEVATPTWDSILSIIIAFYFGARS